MIWVNDEHPEKELFQIDVTEEGIEMCVNDKHLLSILFPINAKDEEIMIYINDEVIEKGIKVVFQILFGI